MLSTLFTYHQVDFSYLENLYTFGDQEDPKDVCLAGFAASKSLAKPSMGLIALPKLGRSGREIRVSYLLRSVESKNRDWKWQVRQAAVYHSFDTETGRSFWFTIKGNGEFARRTMDTAEHLCLPATSAETTVGAYFEASLCTHLVYISWCDENWREFINDVENGVRQILDHARKSPVDDDLDDEATPLPAYPKPLRELKSRRGTMSSKAQTRNNTGSLTGGEVRRKTTWEVVTGARKAFARSLSGRTQRLPTDLEKAPNPSGPGLVEEASSPEPLIDVREVLDKFRFRDMQTICTFSDRVQRAILTLKLNISALGDLRDFYSKLLTSDIESFRPIRSACEDSLANFIDEVRSVSRSLETRRQQLECLSSLLAEGATLVRLFRWLHFEKMPPLWERLNTNRIVQYDGVLQHRQLDISQRFQVTALKSADQMQVIANKTKLETASMHIITVVTLVFLPETFVAVRTAWLRFLLYGSTELPKALTHARQTFFQSGVFLWNESVPEDMTESYRYQGDGFSLFAWVSVPLLLLTLGIWLFVYMRLKKNMTRVENRRGSVDSRDVVVV
jgi:hypothetical protein